ncbi:hypothetical protein P168DRAFT_315019 [Aspergillus campestris IBT 28561]|uniref:Rhodopsin domain-containing protein n=1 Tax=Aspergillus campestris (strain IBT 28561) TaxID=1392248 RepID=A0A2I1DGH8_ASPC2|nr:uncharacterized protein P168DRAFT_315019 [Aspergillus campestris IBT 28561]PKY08977.1 hypothetical protein P168DRAFT_315019 [Aspergillus campestris IBT 28561]
MSPLDRFTGPPDTRTAMEDNPTLLVSWWATMFSFVIIVTRICGRYVRIERLFPEDKVMMISVIPLIVRMALVHLVLKWGTNNTKTEGLTEEDIRLRELGSRMVLASRIFYAIFIWTAKLTVCEFLKRLTWMIWRRSIQRFLQFLYYFLVCTLIAVVIATLAECQPFDHYWQVVPDPGPHCRSGYANLITMGACDVITDLLLVAFPIPLILRSHMTAQRKLSLVVLFALSLILVGITCYRVPSVIKHDGSQQYRSLLASLEILAATAVANAVVIGSFVRDRGIKKTKFKKSDGSASVSESMGLSSSRRATISHHQWGSDDDLAGDLGMRLDPKLCSSDHRLPRVAPVAGAYVPPRPHGVSSRWHFPGEQPGPDDEDADDRTSTTGSLDMKVHPHEYLPTNKPPRNPSRKPSRKQSRDSSISPRHLSLVDISSGTSQTFTATATAQQHLQFTQRYPLPPPQSYSPTSPLEEGGVPLQDVGGLLSAPPTQSSAPSRPRRSSPAQWRRPSVHFGDPPDYVSAAAYRPSSDVPVPPIPEGVYEVELRDVGGLLERSS